MSTISTLNILRTVLNPEPDYDMTLPRPAQCPKCGHVTKTKTWHKSRCSKCGKTLVAWVFYNPLDGRQFEKIPIPKLILNIPDSLH